MGCHPTRRRHGRVRYRVESLATADTLILLTSTFNSRQLITELEKARGCVLNGMADCALITSFGTPITLAQAEQTE